MLEAAIAIAAIAVGAGLAMGIGAVGPAVGEGYVCWQSCGSHCPSARSGELNPHNHGTGGRLSLSPLVSTHWLLPYC